MQVINFGHREGNMNLYPATAFPITCLLCRCHMCFVLSSFSWCAYMSSKPGCLITLENLLSFSTTRHLQCGLDANHQIYSQ